jgi:hypothetical protein
MMKTKSTENLKLFIHYFFIFIYLVWEAIGTAATPGLLCQPRVIVKTICGEADGM